MAFQVDIHLSDSLLFISIGLILSSIGLCVSFIVLQETWKKGRPRLAVLRGILALSFAILLGFRFFAYFYSNHYYFAQQGKLQVKVDLWETLKDNFAHPWMLSLVFGQLLSILEPFTIFKEHFRGTVFFIFLRCICLVVNVHQMLHPVLPNLQMDQNLTKSSFYIYSPAFLYLNFFFNLHILSLMLVYAEQMFFQRQQAWQLHLQRFGRTVLLHV